MKLVSALALTFACLAAAPARATLVDGAARAFAVPPRAFAVAEDGLVNPSLTFTGLPGYGALTLSYGPYFTGQTATDPVSPPTSVSGAPTGPLSLDSSASPTWQTVVETDASNPDPNAEVLGGAPAVVTNGFGGPIALLFSTPVAGVELTAGFLDIAGSATIEAFATDGASLGSVVNTGTGYEVFDLSDSAARGIAGLLITTVDPAGLGIDGVGIFQTAAVVGVPAPGAWALLPALALLLRRRAAARASAAGEQGAI